jgi:hypothetical protein
MDLIAGDLRKSILEDIKREDVVRKAQETADEEARKAAVEEYQETIKLKLAQLHMKTEDTQQRIKEVFGNSVDESQVKKFLNEQQSQQMQDEFGEILLQFGVGTTLAPKSSVRDPRTNSERDGASTFKRRYDRPGTLYLRLLILWKMVFPPDRVTPFTVQQHRDGLRICCRLQSTTTESDTFPASRLVIRLSGRSIYSPGARQLSLAAPAVWPIM